jgi:hypothetical protein
MLGKYGKIADNTRRNLIIQGNRRKNDFLARSVMPIARDGESNVADNTRRNLITHVFDFALQEEQVHYERINFYACTQCESDDFYFLILFLILDSIN